MRLDLIMEEVASVLGSVTGLRISPHPVKTLTPPAGVVGYPEGQGVAFHQTYGQGETSISDLPVHLIANNVTDRVALETASAWLDEDSLTSAVGVLEAHAWTTCDEVTVTSADFSNIAVGSVEYLDVVLHLDITHSG
jgi:hypothetical protein